MNLSDVDALNKELENAIINFSTYHSDMYTYKKYYQYSAFYARKAGDTPLRQELKTNLLKVFADKNMQYTSSFPTIKVPTTGSTPEQRQAASIREKILYAVHEKSGTPILQKKWAYDASIMSVAIAETTFNVEKRCVEVKRYDPRFVFWQLSNDNSRRVLAFWAVFPITADEVQKRYGFRPTGNQFSNQAALTDNYLTPIDGKDWFAMAIRWDENTRVSWVGDRQIEEPHNHLMGGIPIDVCMPFDDLSENNQGSFYLEPLIPLQAELNHVIKQRANIVQRMANPVVWGRNIHARQFDEVKDNLSKAGGGFVGLRQQGELGLLQVNDVKLLDAHANDLITHMMRLSGYGNASFGENVGANTSGDALGMYFNATQRFVEHQQIAWAAFYKSINSKILRLYYLFAKYNEQFHLDGYAPRGTVVAATDDPNRKEYQSGAFDIVFDKATIGGNFNSRVIFPAATPKNEILDKRFWLDAMNLGQVSKTTGYENIGIESPEDELALLTQEQSEPALNPDGTQKILQSATQYAQAQQPTLPAATPAPIGGANGV